MPWTVDPNHSRIDFSARHMMIYTVRGWFDAFDMEINYDEQNPANSTVEATIEAASINTRSEQRDAHLKSPDFLYVEKYPTMHFKGKRVEQSGQNRGRLVGDLTIRGITREVALDVNYNGKATNPWGTTVAAFAADTKINRKEWDLSWNMLIEGGSLLVGEEITIHIELELHKQTEQAPEVMAEAAEAVAA